MLDVSIVFVCVCVCVGSSHLICLRAGQTACQRSTAAGQSGGEGRTAVRQDGLQVTGQLLRRVKLYTYKGAANNSMI